jgi:hypothetical protein
MNLKRNTPFLKKKKEILHEKIDQTVSMSHNIIIVTWKHVNLLAVSFILNSSGEHNMITRHIQDKDFNFVSSCQISVFWRTCRTKEEVPVETGEGSLSSIPSHGRRR